MKTYDIWKMIDEDYESVAGKKIKLVKTPTDIEKVSVGDIASIGKNARGIPCLFDKWEWRIQDLTGFEEWEEVKEPVDFIEAVKSGKRIKSCYVSESTHYLSLNDYLAYLSQCYVGDELRDILNGKWYIED